MKDTARGPRIEEESTLPLQLVDVVREDLRAFVVARGMEALAAMLERERTTLCGPRYRHDALRTCSRAGHTPSELVMGGRRVSVQRPRVRDCEGREVPLASWGAFCDEDPLEDRAVQQMLLGVSTRKYADSLEPLAPELDERGTSKSAVSRRFVELTAKKAHEWLARPIDGADIVAVLIDGIHVDDHVFLVALGIDREGRKHVLGLREGATENATCCRELLSDMRERGLSTDKVTLFVLDGSKALSRAVRDVFGSHARIQRCQVHKTRNVVEQLPESMRASVKATMRQAYRTTNADKAKQQLVNLARRLREVHPSAAASLEEGLDETLTVKRFDLPSQLERILSTTNAIENLMGSVRHHTRRVKKWKDGQMMLRWIATALADASERFRRVMGAKAMRELAVALRGAPTNATVAEESNAA
jgi:transposase-like protein